jgi:hypothetical protein
MAVDESWLNRQLEDVNRQLRELPPSVAASFAPVVANLQATIIATIQATYSTTAQMNAAIANPGNINPANVNASGNVTASGQVSSNGSPVKSLPSHNFTVTTGYVACWINGDGQFGTSPSSAAAKIDLTEFTPEDAKRFLATVTPYWGRYKWDAPDSALKVFVTAEQVAEAGYGPDVAPVVDGDEPLNIGTDDDPVMVAPGQAWTVNYSQLVIPLIAVARVQDERIAALEAQVAALVAGGDSIDG